MRPRSAKDPAAEPGWFTGAVEISPHGGSGAETSPQPAGVRVLVVDDEQLVRTALTTVLGSADDIEVVAAVDGVGAASALAARRVDVVLTDLRMPRVDGLAVVRHVVSLQPPRPVVAVLTSFADDALVAEALACGAAGYLVKDSSPDQLVDAVRRLARGASVLSAEVTPAVIDGFLRSRPDVDAAAQVALLSPREREVLALLACGEGNGAIAAQLHLSSATVKYHVSSVMTKLDVENRVQAALVAVRAGLVTPGA
ncbi:two component transcriptional regulator, LuxR family [Quadrisphaera granulorum]|uniref:LuxR family two component transcriptional regulator n=1 Tax=Quadrisphaera granulorum TaxID=317664 RepID=A0A315ZKA3_9ACTN|nr:response regulator transcription factor [Quadrisphaera granulorum]PWJ45603.1 LuxR family two component transcriptional regulator [Quadrisphaera granulorum]SZE99158.1 two component transcriptional regulator, LuxR family [Quadrisphaera granulorum]